MTDSAPARRFPSIEAVVNIASGSVGPGAPDQLAAILAEFGLTARVRAPAEGALMDALSEAVAAGPDLVIILAGDGTARAAAELSGPKGPLIAPLPGGTMNMLPHAIYGSLPWPEALRQALLVGEERVIAGGAIGERTFLVAAILGSAALWAPAREAVRKGRLRMAALRAQRAWRQAFSGRLRYGLDGGPRAKTGALTLLCPLTSRRLDDEEQALEAAALDPSNLAQVLRLGARAALGDWRDDPDVQVSRCRVARVWSSSGIPALLDGESVRLRSSVEVRFRPAVARILGLPAPETAS